MIKHNLLPRRKGTRQARVNPQQNTATDKRLPFGTGAKTIYSAVDNLTVKESALILSAFNYQVLRHGVVLLSVPAPVGYGVWVNCGPSFVPDAEKFLSENGIKAIVK